MEDKAIKLAKERAELERRLAKTITAALGLMDEAEHAGVPIDRLADLIQVRRSTLYRWRQASAIYRAHHQEGE